MARRRQEGPVPTAELGYAATRRPPKSLKQKSDSSKVIRGLRKRYRKGVAKGLLKPTGFKSFIRKAAKADSAENIHIQKWAQNKGINL